jgi:hypothetical protein
MLEMYMNKYLRGDFVHATKIIVEESIDEKVIKSVAERTEGFRCVCVFVFLSLSLHFFFVDDLDETKQNKENA